MLKTWAKVVTKPGEKVFAAELEGGYATLQQALAWIIAVNIAVTLIELGQGKLTDMWVIPPHEMDPEAVPPEFFLMIGQPFMLFWVWLVNLSVYMSNLYAKAWLLSDSLVDLGYRYYYPIAVFVTDREWLFNIRRVFLNPVYFVLSMGVYHGLARLFGGRGRFGRYAYLFALYMVPLALLSSLMDFLPLLGPMVEVSHAAIFPDAPSSLLGQFWYRVFEVPIVFVISWLLSFYGIALAYFATRTEHRLVWWRAIVVVVVGYVLAFVIRNSPSYSYWGLIQATSGG